MNTESRQDRRQFDRITFDVPAQLYLDDGELASEIIDFSLKGALIKRLPEWHPAPGTPLRLECDLSAGQGEWIRMETVVRRVDEDVIGLECINIDLDSIMRLRRLLEFNLSDPSLLERNLEHLIRD